MSTLDKGIYHYRGVIGKKKKNKLTEREKEREGGRHRFLPNLGIDLESSLRKIYLGTLQNSLYYLVSKSIFFVAFKFSDVLYIKNHDITRNRKELAFQTKSNWYMMHLNLIQ